MGKLPGNGPSVPRPKSEFSQTMEVGQERMENRSAGDPAGDSSVQTETLRRPAVTALMFGVVALALFWARIGNPGVMIYDEANYVPAAKAFLIDAPNPNPEAPPLGKLLIAVAIKAVGDNPFGWRVAGSVCGALTLTAGVLWTYLLARDFPIARIPAGLTFCNKFLFLMFPVSVVDSFLVFFLLLGFVVYTAGLVF